MQFWRVVNRIAGRWRLRVDRPRSWLELATPLYYFQIIVGSTSVEREGAVLADLAGAKKEAVKLLGSLLLENAEQFRSTTAANVVFAMSVQAQE